MLPTEKHDPVRRSGRLATPQRRGFTLIEILVVVAIIALLVGILLPALTRARGHAKSAACASQLGQLTRAEATYEAVYKGWIPGTAKTTGHWFNDANIAANGGSWIPGANGQPKLANRYDYWTPLRIEMYGQRSIPNDLHGVYRVGTEGPFHCPSNPHIAVNDLSYGHSSPAGLLPPIRAYSYLPMRNIMIASDEVGGGQDRAGTTDAAIRGPPGYVPRSDKLGRTSVKVFLADGLHQYDPITKKISYFSAMLPSRGVMGPPPSDAVGEPINNRYWRDAWGSARKFSYRHGNNNRINAGFFDGHVKSLLVDFHGQQDYVRCQGFTGPAVRPHLYYPSRSVVRDPTGLHNDAIPVNTELQ